MNSKQYNELNSAELLEVDLLNRQGLIMDANSKKDEIKENPGLTKEKKTELIKPIQQEIDRLFQEYVTIYEQLKEHYPEIYCHQTNPGSDAKV